MLAEHQTLPQEKLTSTSTQAEQVFQRFADQVERS